MPSRLIALLLVILLSWSGFTAQDPALALASAPAEQAAAHTVAEPACGHGGPAGLPLQDEWPAQAQAESAMELPALVMAPPDAPAPTLRMGQPHPYAVAAWRAPYLGGPQRPPRAARQVA